MRVRRRVREGRRAGRRRQTRLGLTAPPGACIVAAPRSLRRRRIAANLSVPNTPPIRMPIRMLYQPPLDCRPRARRPHRCLAAVSHRARVAVASAVRRAACAAALLASPALAVAQAPAAGPAPTADTLFLDHAGKTATFRRRPVESGDQLRIRSPFKLTVVVARTNSAVFDCDVGQTKTSTAEVDAALGFLKGLGPYLQEMALAAAARPDTAANNAYRRAAANLTAAPGGRGDEPVVRQALEEIDEALTGARGLRTIFTRTAAELERMRGLPPDSPLALGTYQTSLSADCVFQGPDCARLRATERLTTALSVLGARYGAFASAVTAQPSNDPNTAAAEKRLVERGASALSDADALLAAAYAIEQMVRRTYGATRTMTCDDVVSASWNSGRDVTVAVTPTTVPGVARTRTGAPYTMKASVHPDWLVRPTVGLAFVGVPNAKFPKFATKQLDDTTYRVQEAGSTDGRFTYGLVLASTWRGLDYRDARVPWAVYLPELTINPSADLRAFAVGAGVLLYNVKLGVGRAWTKHSVLAGQTVGTTLRDPDELSTRETYGPSKPYVSIALVGLPPFVP
ncbi:hypothetical protein [Roseisolibacter agri]|uniref:Uncharacterized protein n=1 Tax=Roseisolibacter agri TaxID=2014610 RepID=A0AA37VCZ2_9BACT|nr:hypothetical protein [Roseisolibacter agri]GLC28228.1 hypothetical protein rosag_47410 [Roseisolibacter agri]